MVSNLDMDCMRTLAAIADLGSFTKAADRVGRSLPAVSMQIDRLQRQVGAKLFRKQGRGKVLTEEGESLLGYARQILAANDAAVVHLAEQDRVEGPVRLGVVQDVAEHVLSAALTDFANAHPEVRLDVRVERSPELIEALERGDIDLAISFDVETKLVCRPLAETPMVWIGGRGARLGERETLPLVLFEEPCAFRAAALRSLQNAGRQWRIAVSCASLWGVRAAVAAGFGVTARTKQFFASSPHDLVEVEGLPPLPVSGFALYLPPGDPSPACALLADICSEQLRML